MAGLQWARQSRATEVTRACGSWQMLWEPLEGFNNSNDLRCASWTARWEVWVIGAVLYFEEALIG